VKGSVSSGDKEGGVPPLKQTNNSLHQLQDYSNLLKEGSLEHAFLGNVNKTRLLFQIISFKFDQAINCFQVELSDGSEFSSNCVFSEKLTNQVESNINLWSIIEVLEYDIIADKFIEVRKFLVRQKLTRMIGDPDPIEDSFFLKIHRGDFHVSYCMSNQMSQAMLINTENTEVTDSEDSKRNKKISLDGDGSSSVLYFPHKPCSKDKMNEQIFVPKECYVRIETKVAPANVGARESSPRHKCEFCDYEVTNKWHLKTHIDAEHLGIRYYCDHCPYEAKAKRYVQRHVEAIHDGIRYICDKCNYEGKRKWDLKRHVEFTHNGNRFKCEYCDYKTIKSGYLEKHIQFRHRDTALSKTE